MSDPFGTKKSQDKTHEAFLNPEVGFRFTEMYSFWMYVIEISESRVLVMESTNDTTSGWKLRGFSSIDQFRKAYAYGSIPGYFVTFVDKVEVESDWVPELLKEHREKYSDRRTVKLDTVQRLEQRKKEAWDNWRGLSEKLDEARKILHGEIDSVRLSDEQLLESIVNKG